MSKGAEDSSEIRWWEILSSLVSSGMWSELSSAEKSLLVVLLVKSNRAGKAYHGSVDQASMAGLARRSFQIAIKRLLERGLITRTWDGNLGHAADSFIRPFSAPGKDWSGERKQVAQRRREEKKNGSARHALAHGAPASSAKNGRGSADSNAEVAHPSAPPPYIPPSYPNHLTPPPCGETVKARKAANGGGGDFLEKLGEEFGINWHPKLQKACTGASEHQLRQVCIKHKGARNQGGAIAVALQRGDWKNLPTEKPPRRGGASASLIEKQEAQAIIDADLVLKQTPAEIRRAAQRARECPEDLTL